MTTLVSIHSGRRVAVLVAVVWLSACATLPVASATDAAPASTNVARVLWRDPGDVSGLDVVNGSGGRANAPDPTLRFDFVSEDVADTSPKFEVRDAHGVIWKAKLGEEARPETAATRLLWVAGYLTDQDYYLSALTVNGLPKLRRGSQLVTAGNVIHGVRLERKPADSRKLGQWDWFSNPFVGGRELNGLRVMMLLLNNWDLKAVNNAVYDEGGALRYVVSDLGATFGQGGNAMQRSKSSPVDYAATTFIERVTASSVDFTLHSRPFFLWIINPPNYRSRTRMEQLSRDIPRTDAAWVGVQLARLSDSQISDCFRAAGYSDGEVEVLARVVRRRIAELRGLGAG